MCNTLTIQFQKVQKQILQPLSAVSEIAHEDIRRHQMECVMSILRDHGNALHVEIWPDVIIVVGGIVTGNNKYVLF